MKQKRRNLTRKRLKEVIEYLPSNGFFIRKNSHNKNFIACLRNGKYKTIKIDGASYAAQRLAGEQCIDWNKCDSDSSAYQYAKANNLIKNNRCHNVDDN